MSTTACRLSVRLSQLSLANGAVCSSMLKQAAATRSAPVMNHSNILSANNNIPLPHINPIYLPGCTKEPKVYTFPTADRMAVQAPAPFLQQLIEKFDPLTNNGVIEAPSTSNAAPGMYAAPRLLTIRRKKMKKHKRRKRYDRDFFKYAKYHREKKLKAERAFRGRMKDLLDELNSFDAEEYVKNVIQRAKREWTTELAPSGRKLYPHWSTLMSIEELYGLPKSDYIDKKAGLPSEEDIETIKQLKIDYYRQFRGEDIELQNKQAENDGKNEK